MEEHEGPCDCKEMLEAAESGKAEGGKDVAGGLGRYGRGREDGMMAGGGGAGERT